MKHDCITAEQGRRACTCANEKPCICPGGSAWDWIDAIPHSIDRALLALFALVIVAGFIKFFPH